MSRVKKAPKDTKSRIKKAALALKKKGTKIVSRTWGVEMDEEKGYFVPDDHKQVCPLGALVVYLNGNIKYDKFRGNRDLGELEVQDVIMYVLGVDEDWVNAFTAGVDDGDKPQNFGGGDIGWDEDLNDGEGGWVKKIGLKVQEHRRAFLMGKDLADELMVE